MSRSLTRIVIAAALVAVALVAAACTTPTITFVDQGATYDASGVQALLAKAELGSVAEADAADAVELRRAAMVSLRKQGEASTRAAELITKTFPATTASVPVMVELAEYDGVQAYVIVEAMGPEGGKLSDARVWVLSDSGDVLFSAMR